MFDWLRSLIFPPPKPFLCGWALARSAFHEAANNDMPRDLGELMELHGTRLQYREMLALAQLFATWAATEDVSEEQRNRLLRSGMEFAQLAEFCGSDWQPRNRNEQKPDLLKFIVQDALVDDDDCWRSDRARVAEEFLEALARRMIALLEASANPDAFIVDIRHNAEQAGILQPEMKIRSLPYSAFVRDLLLDNPRTIEWAGHAHLGSDLIASADEATLLSVMF